MTSHLYQVLAISWFVASAACVDVVLRAWWPFEADDRWTGFKGWKGVRLAARLFGAARYEARKVPSEAAVIGTLASVLIAFATALSARWLLSIGGVL